MSRIVSLLVGIYAGIVVDQSFEVPKIPAPSALIEYCKTLGSDKKK